ncbi:MAG TPA: helix-turn-helix domain-containing protein [Nevskiaceae bacterium]|nr:helix-turn-helix domain-containing protein [Nevskiaceae bacterium]
MSAGSSHSWQGQVRLGLGWALFQGQAGDNQPHAHHALQLVLAASPVRVWVAGQGECEAPGLLIGADVLHRLHPSPASLTLVYLDRQSRAGQQLAPVAGAALRLLSAAQVSALQAALRSPEAVHPDQLLLRHLGSAATGEALSDHWLAPLEAALAGPASADQLARAMGLSTPRFLHRVKASTGLPLRPYRRWRRLIGALTAVLQGQSMTAAAHAAGFADAAHFTRTCRRHFGITPSALGRLAGS